MRSSHNTVLQQIPVVMISNYLSRRPGLKYATIVSHAYPKDDVLLCQFPCFLVGWRRHSPMRKIVQHLKAAAAYFGDLQEPCLSTPHSLGLRYWYLLLFVSLFPALLSLP